MAQFPAVLVTGPRQSGKTTFLVEEVGDRCEYVTMDDPLERAFAAEDARGFLARFGDRPTIIDEVQYSPALLQYIKLAIDSQRSTTGRWLLTGSQHFGLMRDVSESLAGRVAILELMPFAMAESGLTRSLEETVWVGGYPEVCLNPERRDLWVKSYLKTYLERDVRQLMNVKDLAAFEAFVALLAARHGQTLNMAALSRDLGVSAPTVRQWIAVLEASYVVYLLRPYHDNFGKRITKSPKLYFLDSALVAALTRHPDGQAAVAGPMGGAFVEGIVVTEAIKAFTNRGATPDLYFWRSRDGLEVDLLVQAGRRVLPLEIKSTATPRTGHVAPLLALSRLAKGTLQPGRVVCRVASSTPLPHGATAEHWRNTASLVEAALDGAGADSEDRA